MHHILKLSVILLYTPTGAANLSASLVLSLVMIVFTSTPCRTLPPWHLLWTKAEFLPSTKEAVQPSFASPHQVKGILC